MSDKAILGSVIGGMVLTVFLCIGMGGYMISASAENKTQDISSAEWESLAAKKVYFGHQSVGANVMDGVNDLARAEGRQKINIKETKNPNDFNQPIFAHSSIGKNFDPISKVNDFKEAMDNALGDKVDIAFFKFCYVDIDRSSDIEALFNHYSAVMEDLELRHGKTKFVHFTVPVRVRPSGGKASVKRLIGMASPEEEDNLRRNDFNRMLKEKYGPSGRVFDLAGYEATYADGKINSGKNRGRDNLFLIPEYSDDGKHLNSRGAKIIAARLLRFLASLP